MTELETALQMIEFKKHHESYHRLKMAVQLVIQDDNRMRRVQKEIYIPVGDAFGCTWQCVERSIRYRIGIVWSKNPCVFDCICRTPLYEKPTTADLIEYMAEYVREKSLVYARPSNLFRE